MIMLLGSSGGIGSKLKPLLGNDVFGIERKHCDLREPVRLEELLLEKLYIPNAQPLHIVNCAGISINGMCHKQSVEDFDNTFTVNVETNWLLLKYARDLLKVRGGSVTMMSSVVAARGQAGCTLYGASKGALHGMVRSACKELAPFARVNVIELGYFNTGMIGQLSIEALAKVEEEVPMKRLGTVEDIAKAVKFCMECEYLTGSVIRLNGGLA